MGFKRKDDQALAAEDKKFVEFTRFSIVVNAKIASAEALSNGFPDAPLYAMYRAFDYVAKAFDPVPERNQDGRPISAGEYLDAASAMLAVAYFYASSMIGDYYTELYEGLWRRVSSVDVSAYDNGDDDGKIGRLMRAKEDHKRIIDEFRGTLVAFNDGSFEDMSAKVMSVTTDKRRQFIDLADRWVNACKERYAALCEALPIFEQELTRTDPVLEVVDKVVGVVDDSLTAADAGSLIFPSK